ncbi:hypothetical protein [Actinomycetospora soli]|uniref:hypothetical protein n=1 Tax=Actinomycetospora soli TaxID=2893887 RepID=UPI001E64642E|nr:hypothetical protein [Actinomycetospora soli]MCD2188293.1 hypothetical protein [Actinomycetospora soli]
MTRTDRAYAVPGTDIRIAVTTPRSDPGLWAAHLDGLDRLYAEHGVSEASRVDEDRTSLVFTALDPAGEVLAGIRSDGPLAAAEDAQALEVWGGAASVRAVIERWIPDGLVEAKGFWMARSFAGRRELIASMKRTPVLAGAVLGARWAMGTAAHTMRLFRAAGATVVDTVPAVPYPDARYRTSLAYWDRWHWAPDVPDAEIRAFDDDVAQLLGVDVPRPRAAS